MSIIGKAIGGKGGVVVQGSGTSIGSTGTIQFSNSHGLSFGLANNVMTGSHDGLTTQSIQTQNLVTINGSTGIISISGGANITVGNNAGTITISAGAGGDAVRAIIGSNTTLTNSSITFGNANNFSFYGSNGSLAISYNGITTAMASNAGSNWIYASAGKNLTNISATLASNSISLSVGDYITTGRVSNDAVGLNSAGTNITWTVNSSGISIDNPAWLTTAMGSGESTNFVQANAGFDGVNASGTIASDGISVSVAAPGAAAEKNWIHLDGNTASNTSASGTTIVWSAGDNITLAATQGSVIKINGAAGGAGIGLNTAGTNITWTVNSSGISIDNPAWLTTAMVSNAGSNWIYASAGKNLTNISATLASNSISLSVGAYITTARASNDAIGLNTAGTNITWTVNSSGISIDNPTWLTTAMGSDDGSNWIYASAGKNLTNISATLASDSISLSVGAYITTARASNDGVGLNSAGTNITWTVNSAGISIDNPTWLTTAMASNQLDVNLDLNEKAILIDPTLGTNLEYEGEVLELTVSGLTVGQCVYVNGNNTGALADADAVGTMPAIGIYVGVNLVLTRGTIRQDTWGWTAGNRLYVGVDGELTATAPNGTGDYVQIMGIAVNATTVLIMPSLTEVKHL